MNLTCNKCGKVKHEDEFYNCKPRKTGKQPNCKTCQKIYAKKWRDEINPEYYWGQDGYFVRRYAETIQYQMKYKKADKDCKVYRLTFGDGDIYIGYTKRNIGVRLIDWKRKWHQFNKNQDDPNLGSNGVFKAIIQKGLTEDQVKELWDSVEVLKEFPGTRYAGLKAEQDAINEHLNKGYTLVNLYKINNQ